MKIALWVVKGLLAAAFLGAGGAKLAGNAKMAENFSRWGFPRWFMPLIGFVEVAGAFGLLVPQTAVLACAGLIIVMVSAVGTHLGNREYGASVPALFLLALLTFGLINGRGVL
jgi:uncharacterized membrane protein